ncbi:Txe/YoeB family addiction module toxin [Candidatus Peregrinibacteria bacterium]|jgi:toxin YoeB|nr:Txe/YoeB family addiction module toxin [Candidatus Peregrinibacteria bacterium]
MRWILNLTKDAKKDLQFFKDNNSLLYEKCFSLMENMLESPSCGIGKPEKLKYSKDNLYSRRVNREHRLVYIIDNKNKEILVISMRKHYQ